VARLEPLATQAAGDRYADMGVTSSGREQS
jgi:hypothetical protein